MNEMSEMLRRKPSFSIEDILSPNFGSCLEVSIAKSSSSSGQKLLDSNKTSTSSSTIKVDHFKAQDSSFVPAWIFSTRYSDRPASGKIEDLKLRSLWENIIYLRKYLLHKISVT